jgi:hypothetical protein
MARECAHQHQETGFRQVKIRQQRVDSSEAIARRNEDVGLAVARAALANCFECANASGPDSYTAGGFPYRLECFLVNVVTLGMQFYLFCSADVYRSEGTESDVQSYASDGGAAQFAFAQNLGREMEARGWRGDGSGLSREDSLVPFAILGRIRPLDVWRQRHVSHRGERGVQVCMFAESNGPLSMVRAREHVGKEVVAEVDALANWNSAARADERFPRVLVVSDWT